MRIARDYKIFWITVPIELPGGEGVPVRVGISFAHICTNANETISGDDGEKNVAFDKFQELAEWLVPKDDHNVRFKIRRNDSVTFCLPVDLRAKRNNYVVGIRISHGE